MNKYHAKKTAFDGINFASKKEASRYFELKILEKAKLISNLELQVPFPIVVNKLKICTYVADFVYLNQNGVKVVEDAKGVRTPLYKLKKKLVKAVYDIEIYES